MTDPATGPIVITDLAALDDAIAAWLDARPDDALGHQLAAAFVAVVMAGTPATVQTRETNHLAPGAAGWAREHRFVTDWQLDT